MSLFLINETPTFSKYNVIHNKQKIDVPIYDDDTVKDVMIKLAIHSKQPITSDHIFAWVKTSKGIESLSFVYPNKNKLIVSDKKIDTKFVNSENQKVSVQIEPTYHKLIESFKTKDIFFMTLLDYLDELSIDYKQILTDEKCNSVYKNKEYNCSRVFNGLIRKYWPRIDELDFINFTSSPLELARSKKMKIESKIFERNNSQLKMMYNEKNTIFPSIIKYSCIRFQIISEDDMIIHIFRLFSDIKLISDDLSKPMTKLTLDNYRESYCKLLKESISYNFITDKQYVSKELFIKWFNGQNLNIPNTPLKYIDLRNSFTIKLKVEDLYITLLFFSHGTVEMILNNHTNITKNTINKAIDESNKFIRSLNKDKIYSSKSISLFSNNSYYSSITSYLYDIKDYDPKLMNTILTNLPSFVRIHKQDGNLIYGVYKRVSDYESTDSKLRIITLLHRSKDGFTKDDIIKEISKIFNLGEEEALDEYESWEQLTKNGKIVKKDESGIEFIIDLLGTNIKLDLSESSNYNELKRLNYFFNFVMKVYIDYKDKTKDPYKLCKTKHLEQINEDIIDTSEIRLLVQPDIEEELDTHEERLENQERSEPSEEELRQSLMSDTEGPLEFSSSESSESSDSSLGKLDDSDSQSGGFKKIQKGGYNVNRYYLSRLNQYDKPLFSGYSSKQHKSKKNKEGTQGYTYARKCASWQGRQPIALSKEELDKINNRDLIPEGQEFAGKYDLETGEGGYWESVSIEGRDPSIHYICPKYWDVKNERPRDPKKKDLFEDKIVNNKLSSKEKKNTDKYILVRDEQGYWDEAGDDLSRYKIELISDFHPKGYNVPCCFAARENSYEYNKGWVVDVLINNGTKWVKGEVKEDSSITSSVVKVYIAGITPKDGQNYDKKLIRRHRESKYITNSFPCNVGVYGQLNPVIKKFIHQDLKHPDPKEKYNLGLIRKGIKRGSEQGDQTFLLSIQEILKYTNPSLESLISNIMKDLNTMYDISNISSIAGGAFINKFKCPFDKLSEQGKQFVEKKLNKLYKKNVLQYLSTENLSDNISLWNLSVDIYYDLDQLTSIAQFNDYLNNPNEILLDMYIIPVLESISKLKDNSTFGKEISKLSILVFEGNMGRVFITPPIGGFNKESESMIFLYKERGHFYEPILYRKGNQNHTGILQFYTGIFRDQYDRFQEIIKIINDKLSEYTFSSNNSNDIMDLVELTTILDSISPVIITKYVYDSYHKLTHCILDNKKGKNVIIPIRPTEIPDIIPEGIELIYIFNIEKFPLYEDVISLLKFIDSNSSHKKYLTNAGLSVIGYQKGSKVLKVVKEIILESGYYIPIKNEKYDFKKHDLTVTSHISPLDVDKHIATNSNQKDDYDRFIEKTNYEKNIRQLLFQKMYLYIRENSELFINIRQICDHPIKLRPHKIEELDKLLDKHLRKLVDLKSEKSINKSIFINEKNQIIIYNSDKELYNKIYYLFLELLVIYSKEDYERFIQSEVSIETIKQNLSDKEIFISYEDIHNESYLDHFIRYSKYIRNVSLYNEELSRKKMIQLHKLKDKRKIKQSFLKQYPQIVKTYFGRELSFVKYELDKSTEIEILTGIFQEIIPDNEEITIEKIMSILEINDINHRLVEKDLHKLSEHYKIGICMISQIQSKQLLHDVILSINKSIFVPKIDDIQMLLLYQSIDNLYHIYKKLQPVIKIEELKKTSKFNDKIKSYNFE